MEEDVDHDNLKDPEKRMVPGAYKGRKTEFHFRWELRPFHLSSFRSSPSCETQENMKFKLQDKLHFRHLEHPVV